MSTKKVGRDGSVSWSQEPSGVVFWEGNCGPTAGANALTTFLNRDYSPETVDAMAGDASPGWRPSTLVSAMNRVAGTANTRLRFRVASSIDLRSARADNPIICLVRSAATRLHWVSVIGVGQGHVWFNHNGLIHDNLSISDFNSRWRLEWNDTKGVIADAVAGGFGALLREMYANTCVGLV